MVYASATLSLAAPEAFMHLDCDDLPPALASLAITLPGNLSVGHVAVDSLPRD